MKLSGGQFDAMAQALLDAFTPGSLEAMVRIQLDERLAQLAGGGNLTEVVQHLIAWAEAQDRVQQLLEGACLANPGNGKLKTLQGRAQAEQWFANPQVPRAATGDPSAERREPQSVASVANTALRLANLRNILADLYPDEPSIRRIVADAGLELSRIGFDARALNTWHAILAEAVKVNGMEAVLAVVLRQYPDYQPLRAAWAAYHTPVEASPAQAYSSVVQVKRKTLERRLALLVQQYEAASNQRDLVLGAAEAVKLQRQLEDLAEQMQAAETELNELRG